MGFGNSLKKGGLYIISSVIEGTPQSMVSYIINENYQTLIFLLQGEKVRPYTIKWLDFLNMAKIKAFPEITVASSVKVGMESLLLAAGLGQMKPNTVMLGFYHRPGTPSENHEVSLIIHLKYS